MTPMTLPRWLPATTAAAFILWAVTIWWMVATLPASGSQAAPAEIDVIAQQVQRLGDDLAALDARVAQLQEERDTLAAALAPRYPSGLAAPAGEEAAEAGLPDEAVPSPESSAFFTGGADRYNCRDFTTFADAQEALRVNGPGDPNRIDMNSNGLACEDFSYPDRPRAASTPTTAATPTPLP